MEVIIIPAPKPIMVKDLHTQQTRAFKSQTEADKFYGKKSGYFKDVRTKLGGRNRHYEIIEVV
ncbi:terminase small subunit [Enterococcus phage vB_Efs19_KEN07]